MTNIREKSNKLQRTSHKGNANKYHNEIAVHTHKKRLNF